MNKEELAARLLVMFVGELEDQVRAMNADLLALEAKPTDAERLKSLFRSAHTLKGAASAANLPPIEQVCHALESVLVEVRDGRRTLGSTDFALFFAVADALADAGKRIKVGGDLKDSSLSALRDRLRAQRLRSETQERGAPSDDDTPGPILPAEGGDGQVRVEADKLDALLASSGQLLVARARVADRPKEMETLLNTATRYADEWTRTDRRLRLSLERAGAPPALGQAVNGMRDNLRQLVHDVSSMAAAVAADAGVLSQATDEMADRVGRLRMRPFADACEYLPRVARDVATAAGKEVELEIIGGAVEVDRAVLNGLREGLTHLVRNAVDHGIELPARRKQAGKPRRGKVTVAAAVRGDRLTVTVSDDGGGLDLGAIRAELVRRGLPIPSTERDLARSLFQDGFSTLAEATVISGRGVGLDIVRAAVERVRGSVDATWIEGRGTRFTLECPPTLATIRAVLGTVGSQILAFPSTYVERLIRVRPEQIRHAEGRAVITTPEGAVPLISLARLLPPLAEHPATGPLSIVLLRAGDGRLAVVMDELMAEQSLVLRPLTLGRRPLPHVSGAAILGTGRVALVLNPASIVAAGIALGADSGPAVMVAATVHARPRILVVDDSITTRTLEQSILGSAGYEVITAVDGADGWRMLQERGCDLVVSDIEMPRMDGFDLCASIRASKRFSELPVVLVTALETPQHRARGLEVGANAYLGKSSFDQQHLLDTIHELIGEV